MGLHTNLPITPASADLSSFVLLSVMELGPLLTSCGQASVF